MDETMKMTFGEYLHHELFVAGVSRAGLDIHVDGPICNHHEGGFCIQGASRCYPLTDDSVIEVDVKPLDIRPGDLFETDEDEGRTLWLAGTYEMLNEQEEMPIAHFRDRYPFARRVFRRQP